MKMFSATVCDAKNCGSWWMNEIPRRDASLGEWMTISSSSMKIWPLSGWQIPPKMFIKVDFPAPLTPTSPTISPDQVSNDTSSSAQTPGNALRIDDILSFGASLLISACLARSEDIQADHRDQNSAFDYDCDKRRYAEQVEGIAQHCDKQQPAHRAEDASGTAR